MATFPTPSQIFTQFQTFLKSLKPSINVNDMNSDFIIRGKSVSGLVSGLYGDQAKVYNDTFVSNARDAAVILQGADYGLSRLPATQAESPLGVTITGTNGKVINPGDLTFTYGPTGVLYTNTTGGTISGGILLLSIQATTAGQIGNVQAPDTLTVVAPPSGVNNTAALSVSLADGTDVESIDSLRARILSVKQSPPAGGNATDYKNFAFLASNAVRTATIFRWGRGLGTVDIYITSGTTNIDTAVTNGDSVVRIPSSIVIDAVQAYYDATVPLTDDAEVFAPTEVDINVTVKVDYAQGLTATSVPSDPVYNPLGLTCLQLVQREVARALYKVPVGGRVLPGGTQGYVVAADIEASLDIWLSAVPDYTTGVASGKLPILADRQVQPLNGSSYDLPVAASTLSAPGTITVTAGV